MIESQFMDIKVMDLSSTPQSSSDFVNLGSMNLQEERIDSEGSGGLHEIMPSYDFKPIRTLNDLQSSNLDDNNDSDARTWNSTDYRTSCDNIRNYSSLDSIRNSKAIVEKDLKVFDNAMVSEIDRTMKKHSDNLLHALDGVSARLSQMESRTNHLECSVDDLKLSIGNNQGTTDGKMRQLENILIEIQTGVENIKDKQQILEAHFQVAELQVSRPEPKPKPEPKVVEIPNTQTPSPSPNPNFTILQNPPSLNLKNQFHPTAQIPPPHPEPYFPSQTLEPPNPHYSIPPIPQTLEPPNPHYSIPPIPQTLEPPNHQYQVPPSTQTLEPPSHQYCQVPPSHQYHQVPPNTQTLEPPSHQYQVPPKYQVPQNTQTLEPPNHHYPLQTHEPPNHQYPVASLPQTLEPPNHQYPVAPIPQKHESPNHLYQVPPITQTHEPQNHHYQAPPIFQTHEPNHHYQMPPIPYQSVPSQMPQPGVNPSQTYPQYTQPSSHASSPYQSFGGANAPQQYHGGQGSRGYSGVYGSQSSGGGSLSGGGHAKLPVARMLPQQEQGGVNKVAMEDVVEKVMNMGFSKEEVRASVRKLTERGEDVDLNAVLDSLMNDGDVKPRKGGWLSR